MVRCAILDRCDTPKSLGYILTSNVSVGSIKDEKRKGEERVAALSDQTNVNSQNLSHRKIIMGRLAEPKIIR